MSAQDRERWSGQFGFVLAAVGSAVGLGNMWRFSYLAAENGGAAFVLLYLLLTFVIAVPVLVGELAIGRSARQSGVAAMEQLGGTRWTWLGVLFAVIPFGVLAFYSVIAGWTARFAVEAVLIGFERDAAAHFGAVSAGVEALMWQLGFIAATVIVVLGGVRAGIERSVRLLMPALFLAVLGLAIYAAFQPGASAGYAFYLSPDFAALSEPSVWVSAASQAFFSLSVATGVMVAYASYLPDNNNLPRLCSTIAIADIGVAMIAGLAIFPLLFAFGLEDQVLESTVGALFIVLPTAFASMGAAGPIVGFVFFAALAVAALTSTVSMLETVVAAWTDRFGGTRRSVTVLVGAAVALCGVAPALDTDVLGAIDAWVANVLLLLAGLGLSVFLGWFLADPITRASRGGERVPGYPIWLWLLRFPIPIFLAYVLYRAVSDLVLKTPA